MSPSTVHTGADLLVRDRLTSLNDLASLAHQMDERLPELCLERAQRSSSIAQMPSVHPVNQPQQTPGSNLYACHLLGRGRHKQIWRRGRAHAVGSTVSGDPGATLPGAALPLLRRRWAPHPFLSGLPKRPSSLEGGVLVNGYPFALLHHKQPVSSLLCLGPGNPHGRGTLGLGG